MINTGDSGLVQRSNNKPDEIKFRVSDQQKQDLDDLRDYASRESESRYNSSLQSLHGCSRVILDLLSSLWVFYIIAVLFLNKKTFVVFDNHDSWKIMLLENILALGALFSLVLTIVRMLQILHLRRFTQSFKKLIRKLMLKPDHIE